MIRGNLFIAIAGLSLLVSCARRVSVPCATGVLSDGRRYEVRRHADCCGCWMLYVNVYRGQFIAEQIIAEMGVGLYEPTRHIFQTDDKGRVTAMQSMMVTMDSSFETVATPDDRLLFAALDLGNAGSAAYYLKHSRQISFQKITGFRRGGRAHFVYGVRMAPNMRDQ